MPANQNKGPIPQYVPVTVAQGIETKIDPNLVQPPKGLQADNVRLTTLGATRKRYGQQLMPALGSGNVNVASTQQQLIALNNNSLSAYDSDDNVWAAGSFYAALNAVPASSIQVASLATQSTGPYGYSVMGNPSVAYIGNIGIFCFDTSSDPGVYSTDVINIVCFDINNGHTYWARQFTVAQRTTGPAGYYAVNHSATAPSAISTPYGLSNCQVVAWGNQFILTFLEVGLLTSSSTQPVGQLLRCFVFAPSISVSLSPNIYTGANCTQIDNYAFPTYWATTSSNYSAYPAIQYCMARNATDFTLAINGTNNGSDTSSQIVGVVSNVQPVTQTSTFTPSYQPLTGGGATLSPIICSMSDTLGVALLALSKVAYTLQTATGGALGFSSSSTAWNSLSPLATPFDVRVKAVTPSTFTYTVSDGYQMLFGTGAGIAGITQSPASYLSLYMASSGQASLASSIVTYAGAPCAWIILGNINAHLIDPYLALVFVNLSTMAVLARAFYLETSFATGARPPTAFLLNGNPTAVLLQQPQDATDDLQYARLVSVTPAQNQVIRTPDGALITGSDTKYYDNQVVRSAGWLKLPEVTVTANTTGTGLLTNGATYSVIVVLADFDAAGNAIYSSPSPAYSVTLSGSSKTYNVALTSVYPAFLPSATGPVVFIYRNSQKDPVSYNLVGSMYMTLLPSTFTDLTLDDNTANAQLYSQPAGGEQPNDPAPPSTCGVATKTRIFLAGSERGSALYFSKPFFAGRAPEFNYGNVLDIEPATGPIVGLAALDDVVVIFKSSYIYLLSGSGPDATGQGVFSGISNISTDRGLVDLNSTVLSNDGVYFRSQRGIELLDRSYTLQYVGQPVETILASNTVVSAVSVPKESQVRFALSNGTTLVYDYTAQGWTTYSYALSSIAGLPMVTSQTVFQGTAYSAVNGTAGGQIYRESAGFLDETNLYPYTIQTAHMPLAGPQGWGRIRRANVLGVTLTVPSRISVQFVYDYGQVTSPAVTYDITIPGAFNVRVRAPRQVAQAVSVIVQNITSSGTGEGSYITGIVFETSQKSGALRLPDTQSV